MAKRIMCYLKVTIYLELIYGSYPKNKGDTWTPNTSSPFRLINYGNNSYAKDSEDKTSIIRYCYIINKAIVS